MAFIRGQFYELPQPPFIKISLKITYLKLNWNLPGANELDRLVQHCDLPCCQYTVNMHIASFIRSEHLSVFQAFRNCTQCTIVYRVLCKISKRMRDWVTVMGKDISWNLGLRWGLDGYPMLQICYKQRNTQKQELCAYSLGYTGSASASNFYLDHRIC